jgi:hypothetical protein
LDFFILADFFVPRAAEREEAYRVLMAHRHKRGPDGLSDPSQHARPALNGIKTTAA